MHKETLNKWLRGRIAAKRGARFLAYLLDMSRSLRSVRLALPPTRRFLQRFHKRLLLAPLLGLMASVPLTGCVPVVATGVGVGAMMVDDRRSTGVYIEDEEIEFRAGSRLREAKLDGVRANFTSYNRRLLITGEAPTEALKARVSEIGRGVPGVKEVYNEMAIAAPIGFAARSNDAYLTTKVKARLFDDSRINANHVKVVTANGVVFLMGLVKRDEADVAASIAARTSGVQRVVKVFEYLD